MSYLDEKEAVRHVEEARENGEEGLAHAEKTMEEKEKFFPAPTRIMIYIDRKQCSMTNLIINNTSFTQYKFYPSGKLALEASSNIPNPPFDISVSEEQFKRAKVRVVQPEELVEGDNRLDPKIEYNDDEAGVTVDSIPLAYGGFCRALRCASVPVFLGDGKQTVDFIETSLNGAGEPVTEVVFAYKAQKSGLLVKGWRAVKGWCQ